MIIPLFCFVFGATAPKWARASSFLRFSRSHTTTHHIRSDSSRRVISSSQRPLADNTQHSQQTDIRVLGEIRTHDLSRRAAADLRLRPRDYWDRHILCLPCFIFVTDIVGLQSNPEPLWNNYLQPHSSYIRISSN